MVYLHLGHTWFRDTDSHVIQKRLKVDLFLKGFHCRKLHKCLSHKYGGGANDSLIFKSL